MKRLFIGLFVSLFIISAASSSMAAYISTAYLSNDLILSNTLPKGHMDLSAKVEYWSASEGYLANFRGNTDFVNFPLAMTDQTSMTLMVVPLRFTEGITNNFALRLTVPYVALDSANRTPPEMTGSGIGDSVVEGLYQFTKETKDMPSMAMNVGVSLPTGKKPDQTRLNELAVGSGATDYYVSGIFGKKMGPANTKTMIGYVLRGSVDMGMSRIVDVGNQIIMSAMCAYPQSDSLEFGGEFSATFGGEDIYDYEYTSNRLIDNQERSALVLMSLSPYVTYAASDDMSVKGVLEIPLATKGTTSMADGGIHMDRGVNISVGVNYTI